MAKLNKKLLWILLLIFVVVAVAGGIIVYRYKFQDPVPHYQEGMALKAKAEAAEADIAGRVGQISDPCEAYHLRLRLEKELAADLWRDSIRSLQKAVQHSRSNHEIKRQALDALADIYKQQGNYQGLLSVWQAILDDDEANYEAANNLAHFYVEYAGNIGRGAWHETWPIVREHAETLLEIDPCDIDAQMMVTESTIKLLAVGVSQDETGDIAKVTNTLEEILAQDQTNVEAYRLLAELSMVRSGKNQILSEREGFEQQAHDYLQAGVDANPDNPDAYVNQVKVYQFPMVEMKYRLVTNLTTEVERQAVRAAADEYAREVLNDLAEMTLRFPDDGRFKTMQAQLLLRIDMSYATFTEAIDLLNGALAGPNADIVWKMTLADYYRRRSEYTLESEADYRAAYDVLRELLYDRQVTDPSGAQEPVMQQLRLNAMQLMVDACTNLAGMAQDDTEKARYLSLARDYVTDFQEQLGEDELAVQVVEGMVLLAEGDRDEGIRVLYNAYKILADSGRRDARLELALFRALRGTSYQDMSLRFGKSAIEAGLNGPGIVLEYMRAVMLSADQQQLQGLIQVIDSFEQQYAGDGSVLGDDYYLLKAEVMLRLGDREQAEQALGLVSEQGPRWQSIKAQTYETPEERAAALEEYVQGHPNDLGAVSVLYRYYMPLGAEDAGYYDRAKEVLDASIAENSDNIALLRMRAVLDEPDPNNISRERDREILLDILQKIDDEFERESQLGAYYSAMAENEQASGGDEAAISASRQQALEHYRAAQAAATGDQSVLKQLFGLLLAEEDWDVAENMLVQVSSRPEVEQLEFEADMLMARGQWAEAINVLNQYLGYRPVSVLAYVSLAQAHINLGQIDQAIEAARQAVIQKPRDIQANRILAIALNRKHQQVNIAELTESDLIEVIRAFDTVAAQEATYQELSFRLVYYPALANYYARQAREIGVSSQLRQEYVTRIDQLYGGAINTCQAIVQSDPSNADNWRRLASLYIGYSEVVLDEGVSNALVEEARAVYERAIAANPSSVSLKTAYSVLLQNLGDDQAAQAIMSQMVSGAEDENWAEARLQRSRLYLLSGEYESAENLLNEVLQAEPDNKAALATLADVYVQTNRYVDAADVYARMRDGEISEATEDIMAQESEVLIMAGEFGRAEQLLDEAESALGEKIWIVMMRSKQARLEGDFDESIDYADQALEMADTATYTVAAMLKAESLYVAGRFNEAMELLQQLRNGKAGANNDGRFLLAQTYWQLGRASDAITELGIAVNNAPNAHQLRSRLAEMMEAEGRWLDLERLFTETLELFPESVDWHLAAGQMYIRQMMNRFDSGDRVQGARSGRRGSETLNRAIELSKEQGGYRRAEAVSMLVTVMRQMGMYQEALAMVEENLTGEPTDAILLLRRAEVLYAMDMQDEALATLTGALDMVSQTPGLREMFIAGVSGVGDIETITSWAQQRLAQRPDWLLARFMVASLYQQAGNAQGQIEVLEPALDLASGDELVRIKTMLAVAYSQAGRDDEAVDLYRELLELYPNNFNFMNNLAYMLLSDAATEQEGYALAQRAYNTGRNNPHIMDTYAWSLLKQGRYEEAEAISRRAIDLLQAEEVPVMGEFYLHWAQALQGLERYDQARETLILAMQGQMDAGTRMIVEGMLNSLAAPAGGGSGN